jgi:hypothetical protein
MLPTSFISRSRRLVTFVTLREWLSHNLFSLFRRFFII